MSARSAVTTSERELLLALKNDGRTVSLAQLSDWRKEGLLPPLASRGRGVGAGRLYYWTDADILAQARCAHDLLTRHGHHATVIRLLWLCGHPVPPAKARRALLKHAKRPIAWQIRKPALAEDARDVQASTGEALLTSIIFKLCSSFTASQRSEMEDMHGDLHRAGEVLGLFDNITHESRHRLFTALSLVLGAIGNTSIIVASSDYDLANARLITESAVRFIQRLEDNAHDDAVRLIRLMETLGEPLFLCALLLQRTGYRAHLMQTHDVMAALLQRMGTAEPQERNTMAALLRQKLVDVWKEPPSMLEPAQQRGAGPRLRKISASLGVTLAVSLGSHPLLMAMAGMAGA